MSDSMMVLVKVMSGLDELPGLWYMLSIDVCTQNWAAAELWGSSEHSGELRLSEEVCGAGSATMLQTPTESSPGRQ